MNNNSYLIGIENMSQDALLAQYASAHRAMGIALDDPDREGLGSLIGSLKHEMARRGLSPEKPSVS